MKATKTLPALVASVACLAALACSSSDSEASAGTDEDGGAPPADSGTPDTAARDGARRPR